MSISVLLGFLVLTCAAAYAQTLTGFAFGLITMGGVGLTGILSLSDAAIVVSLLSFVNGVQMLMKGWRDVAWRELRIVVMASVPTLFAGFWLLEWFSESHVDVLRMILGLAIIVSSLQLARKPEPSRKKSGAGSFAFFGGIAGLMSGMFSTAGPPLVYHFYRQPMPLLVIRETLVTIFAFNAIFRIGLAATVGDIDLHLAVIAAVAVPGVMATTYAARRWPPPLSQLTVRRAVFVLLLLSGVSLGGPALIHFVQGHF
jgi:uncharacterized membrane protein YfcA